MAEKGFEPRQHGSQVCSPNHHATWPCIYRGSLALCLPCSSCLYHVPRSLTLSPLLSGEYPMPNPHSWMDCLLIPGLTPVSHARRCPPVPLGPTSQPGLSRALHLMGRGLTGMSPGPCNPGQQGWMVLPCLSHCVPSMGTHSPLYMSTE